MRSSVRYWILAMVGTVGLLAGCGPDEAGTRNLAPDIESLTSDPEVVRPGGEATLTVGAYDPDGPGTPSDGDEADPTVPSELEVSWEVSDDNWSVAPGDEGGTATLTAADSYDSRVEVTVTVTDPRGASTSESIELGTGENELPRIGSVSASPNPVEPAGTVTLSAEATDARDDELTYGWTAPDGWTLSEETGAQVELTAPDEDGATGQVELEVSDGYEGTDTRSLSVRTVDNAPPSVSSMTASPPQVEPGGETTVKVDATDPDDDELSYEWSAPMGWTVDGEGNEVTVTAPDEFGITGEIAVTITDARDHTATGRVVVSTNVNEGPVINSLTATPQQVKRGKTIDLAVDASDPDSNSLSYTWSVSSMDWNLSDSGATGTLDAPDEPGRSTTVEVTVSDADGKTARASIVVSTSPNQSPSLGSVTASPAQVAPGDQIQLKATASDPDGDTLSYNWQAPSDWSLTDNGADATVTAPGAYGESATITVTVSDGFGGQSTGSVSVSTARNQAPNISGVTANPPVVDKGGTATLQVTASDPNGDGLSYSWTTPQGWSKNGSGDQIKVTAPDQYGTQGLFEVVVSDDNGATSRGSVVVQTESNDPPVVLSMSATKTTLGPEEKTDVTVRARDLNGDQLSYNWTLPQGWKGSSSSDTITATAPREYSTTYEIEVEVSDGTDSTVEKLQVETIPNEQPKVSSFDVQPKPVEGGQDVTATVKASDPLGDSLAYNWSVTNNDWTINGSGDSVKVTSPQKNSSTKVTVTVDDGHGGQVTETETVESVVRLYSFSSHTFSNCGQSGRTGPTLSDCRSAYSTGWDGNGNYFAMDTRGIQKWTVPEDATYTIRAAGAQGGNGGGRGAIMEGDFKLNRGDTVLILVGHKGNATSSWGHGGGGTFVALGSDHTGADPLIVAGGGGGDRDQSIDASTGTRGVDGESGGGAGGQNGEGGDHGGSRAGAGGGGFYTDGGSYSSGEGGRAFRNGGVGGSGREGCRGGFGGGGSCNDQDETGGGGGYSGGGGGDTGGSESGGGGGSFISDNATSAATSDGSFNDQSTRDSGYSGNVSKIGSWNTGHGSVEITKK